MKCIKFNFYLFIFLILLLISPESQGQKINESIEEARKIVSAVMAETNVPGMAVSISIDGKTIWSEGFGFSNISQQKTVDPSQTLFRIGSVSKPLTAVAVGLLYEQGKLNLDAVVQEYVPDFPRKKYDITTRQVAGHLAGIRHYRGIEFMSNIHYESVLEGLKIFQNDPLLFEPESKYNYSTYGWNLISAIVEGASGQPFLDYMQINVFDPMGMKNTYADDATKEIANRTNFYRFDGKKTTLAPAVDNSYKWAGGGFISTSEDLLKFGNAQLNATVLEEQTIQELIKPQKTKDGKSTNYGIGWRSGTDKFGRYWYGHTGGSVGGITQFYIYPKEKLVIAMVSNSSNVNYNEAPFKIVDIFLRYSKKN
ncbi:serine hydrolase domain-containing protein [Fulvivirgaceae bacterium BMA10]|uniref:Serine hydrolase domain-containing protein n=1 Tax=Splendidivirga corallicola TaxID=3051826 RepID=A0ABT8KI94_9BACT|nr:serine hydrolase domain-containing protein [Fulvivirgaceae bacterium BMA10]